MLARELGGWQVICWALVLGAPLTWTVTIVAASHTGLHATLPQWAAFGYTALFSMFLGFFAWYAGLARAGIAKASQVQLAQPALSMVWGWPLLGEHLSEAAMITIAVVLGGGGRRPQSSRAYITTNTSHRARCHTEAMAYNSTGLVVHDADAHVMETPNWLRDHADAAIRDRIPALDYASVNELRQTGDPASNYATSTRRSTGSSPGIDRPTTSPRRQQRSWPARTSPRRERSSPRTAAGPSICSASPAN